MGADGISMWLVLLTTLLVPVSVLVSWKSIHDRVKEFFVLLLLLEMAMIGVFLSLDMFLFYVFWEATLIPMALLIGMYGHERRIYAAVKFFLYTMVASVFMLAAIIWLFTHNPQHNFEYAAFRDVIAHGGFSSVGAAMALPWLLYRLCRKGSAVPAAHVAAGRARGSAHRRLSPAGRRAAQDGHIWPAALLRWHVP